MTSYQLDTVRFFFQPTNWVRKSADQILHEQVFVSFGNKTWHIFGPLKKIDANGFSNEKQKYLMNTQKQNTKIISLTCAFACIHSFHSIYRCFPREHDKIETRKSLSIENISVNIVRKNSFKLIRNIHDGIEKRQNVTTLSSFLIAWGGKMSHCTFSRNKDTIQMWMLLIWFSANRNEKNRTIERITSTDGYKKYKESADTATGQTDARANTFNQAKIHSPKRCAIN